MAVISLAAVLVSLMIMTTYIRKLGFHHLDNISRVYLRTYGRFMRLLFINTSTDYEYSRIKTPIIISNHPSWLDIPILTIEAFPVSYIARYDV